MLCGAVRLNRSACSGESRRLVLLPALAQDAVSPEGCHLSEGLTTPRRSGEFQASFGPGLTNRLEPTASGERPRRLSLWLRSRRSQKVTVLMNRFRMICSSPPTSRFFRLASDRSNASSLLFSTMAVSSYVSSAARSDNDDAGPPAGHTRASVLSGRWVYNLLRHWSSVYAMNNATAYPVTER